MENAEATAQGSREEFTDKRQLVEAAKHRVEELFKETLCAKSDLASTKQAAVKATDAAREAKLNAHRRTSKRRRASSDVRTPDEYRNAK